MAGQDVEDCEDVGGWLSELTTNCWMWRSELEAAWFCELLSGWVVVKRVILWVMTVDVWVVWKTVILWCVTFERVSYWAGELCGKLIFELWLLSVWVVWKTVILWVMTVERLSYWAGELLETVAYRGILFGEEGWTNSIEDREQRTESGDLGGRYPPSQGFRRQL